MITFIIVLLVIAVALGAVVLFVVRAFTDQWADSVTAGVIAAVIVILTGGYSYITDFANEHEAVCHVTGKDRGATSGSYRVYTSNCGTLANRDAWLRGKVNSSDLWQQIPDEGDVSVIVAGVRSGVFSWFPNILAVQPTP